MDIQSGFFPLGDAATASHSKSNVPSLSVSAKVDGALAPPVGFTEIWNDRGSGARADVRIMRMDPPSGYTCLGHVAVVGYSSLPDANQYRYNNIIYNSSYTHSTIHACIIIRAGQV